MKLSVSKPFHHGLHFPRNQSKPAPAAGGEEEGGVYGKKRGILRLNDWCP